MSKKFFKFAALALTPMLLVGCTSEITEVPGIVNFGLESSSKSANDNVSGVNDSSSMEINDIGVNEIPDVQELINGKDFTNAAFALSSGGGSSINDNFPDDYSDVFDGRRVIHVEDCDLRGLREPNVVVDVGYGDREYWAYTNEHGQLIGLVADEITLQEKHEEGSNGRYCRDEAKVPGTESADYDEGHVIADSLGGVANAYNITPQHYYLNRYGEQYDLETRIRNSGGANDMSVVITYPNTNTQIPNSYSFTFTHKNGHTESLSFNNAR